MNVGVAYAKAARQVWVKIDVPEGATVMDAIEQSGILKQFPEINLEEQKVGIFGRVSKLDKPLAEGDRVEIYRPITADPEMLERVER